MRVLGAPMLHGASLAVAQLAADCGLTMRGTRRVLDGLVSLGIVNVIGQPRSQVFTVTTHHPLAAALRALFEQEQQRWHSLQQGLRAGLAGVGDVRSAWLYGSLARGEDMPRSDVVIVLAVSAGANVSVFGRFENAWPEGCLTVDELFASY